MTTAFAQMQIPSSPSASSFGQAFSNPADDAGVHFPSTVASARVVEEVVIEDGCDGGSDDDDDDDDDAFFASAYNQLIEDPAATLTSKTAAASSAFFAAAANTGSIVQYHLQSSSRPSKEHSLRRGLLLPPLRKRSSAAILAATLPTDTQPSPMDDNNTLLEALDTISDTFVLPPPQPVGAAFPLAAAQPMAQLKEEQHAQINVAAAVAAAQHQFQQSMSRRSSSSSSMHSTLHSSAGSPYMSPRSSAGSFGGFEAELSNFASGAGAFAAASHAASGSVSSSPGSPYASRGASSPYGSPYSSPRSSFSQLAPMPGSAGPVRRQRSASPRPQLHRSSNSVIAAGVADFEAAAVGGAGLHRVSSYGGTPTHAAHHYATAGAAQQNGHLIPLNVTFSNPQMLREQSAGAYKELDGTWSTILTDLPTIELNAFLKRSEFTKAETADLKKVRRQRKNQVYTKRSRDRRSNLKSAPAHSG